MTMGGSRTIRFSILAARILVLLLLVVSSRALLTPTKIVHKSQESKRPKYPKNVVRAEPLRVSVDEKQSQGSDLDRPDAAASTLDAGLARYSGIQALPRKAFTQLTKPEYLKSFSEEAPPIPLAPPA